MEKSDSDDDESRRLPDLPAEILANITGVTSKENLRIQGESEENALGAPLLYDDLKFIWENEVQAFIRDTIDAFYEYLKTLRPNTMKSPVVKKWYRDRKLQLLTKILIARIFVVRLSARVCYGYDEFFNGRDNNKIGSGKWSMLINRRTPTEKRFKKFPSPYEDRPPIEKEQEYILGGLPDLLKGNRSISPWSASPRGPVPDSGETSGGFYPYRMYSPNGEDNLRKIIEKKLPYVFENKNLTERKNPNFERDDTYEDAPLGYYWDFPKYNGRDFNGANRYLHDPNLKRWRLTPLSDAPAVLDGEDEREDIKVRDNVFSCASILDGSAAKSLDETTVEELRKFYSEQQKMLSEVLYPGCSAVKINEPIITITNPSESTWKATECKYRKFEHSSVLKYSFYGKGTDREIVDFDPDDEQSEIEYEPYSPPFKSASAIKGWYDIALRDYGIPKSSDKYDGDVASYVVDVKSLKELLYRLTKLNSIFLYYTRRGDTIGALKAVGVNEESDFGKQLLRFNLEYDPVGRVKDMCDRIFSVRDDKGNKTLYVPCWTVRPRHSSDNPRAGTSRRRAGTDKPEVTLELTFYIMKSFVKLAYLVDKIGAHDSTSYTMEQLEDENLWDTVKTEMPVILNRNAHFDRTYDHPEGLDEYVILLYFSILYRRQEEIDVILKSGVSGIYREPITEDTTNSLRAERAEIMRKLSDALDHGDKYESFERFYQLPRHRRTKKLILMGCRKKEM